MMAAIWCTVASKDLNKSKPELAGALHSGSLHVLFMCRDCLSDSQQVLRSLYTWTLSEAGQQQAFICISSLFGRTGDIELEVDNVAVLHYIVLAFLSKLASCLDLYFRFELM